MAQLSDDCFAAGEGFMRLDEAVRLIAERVDCAVAAETVPLAEADGRVLAEAVVSPLDLPPFDNSAVDGYAVRHGDLAPGSDTVLLVAGRGAAGHAPGAGRARAAYRIFTGAPVPEGLDTIFMQEDVRLDEVGRAILPPGLAPGANRRLAGEDLRRGQPALPAGRRLGPADVALLAALGLGSVAVRRSPSVALFSTGDELAGAAAGAGPGRLNDANRPMLTALLRRLGAAVTDGGILPDRRDAVAAAIRGAAGHDLVVTTGGVSIGEEDHVRDALAAAGSLTFWRVAVKPGRPVALGVVAGAPFIGLPGNPVAAFVTFAFLARPLLARIAGEAYAPPLALPVRSDFVHAKKAGRREFVRVRLAWGPDGAAILRKHPRDGAGMLTSLTESDGFAVLDEDATRVSPGEPIAFLPFASLV